MLHDTPKQPRGSARAPSTDAPRGTKATACRVPSWPVFGPSVRRLAHAHGDHFRPTRPAPIVEPLADDFGGGPVVAEHVVEMLMVERRVDEVPQRRKLVKVAHEAYDIEGRRLQDDLDLVVVAVRRGAGMIGWQAADDVRGGEREAFGDRVHGREPQAGCSARWARRASRQYSGSS